MKVLHILNSLEGGATQSVVELMEAGLDQDESMEHYAVYPGLVRDEPNPRLTELCAGVRPIPLATWNRMKDLAPIWRGVAHARALQLTVCGLRTRALLRRLISRWEIDIIHTNTAVIRQGAIIAKQLGMPHVWHVRERLGSGGFMTFWRSDASAANYFVTNSKTIAVISRFGLKAKEVAKIGRVASRAIEGRWNAGWMPCSSRMTGATSRSTSSRMGVTERKLRTRSTVTPPAATTRSTKAS